MTEKKVRLDRLLCDRGLTETRQRARSLILAGIVRVDGRRADKAGSRLPPECRVELAAPDHPYVSRGGVKLARALERFRIEVEGRTCLDVGASTGGFTDCLLRHGAARVIAVDVGRGQIDWRLRQDPRVSLRERCNARYLDRHALPDPIDLAAVDVSFISLRWILPALARLDLRGPVIALVKPQFELRRGEVGKGGVVRDPLLQRRAVEEVAGLAVAAGLPPAAAVESPLTGAEGNREFFLLLGRDAAPPPGFVRDLEEVFHAP